MRLKMLTLFFGAFVACTESVYAGSTGFFAASDSGLFRKSSLDSPWTKVDLDSAGKAGFVAAQGPHLLVLHTDVHEADRGFLSHDGGSTWARVELPWRTVDALYATDSGFFAHRWDGAWVSHDFGEHWQTATGIKNSIYDIGIVAAAIDGNVLAFGFYFNYGISLDAGRHWFNLPERKMRGKRPSCILTVGNKIWMDSQIWNPVAQTWSEQQMPAGKLVALAKRGNRIFAATDAGIFYSDNVGQAWTKALIDSGSPVIREVPQFLEREDIGWVRRFFFGGDTGYVMMNGVLIVSPDKGATWKETENPPPGGIRDLAVIDPSTSIGTSSFDTLPEEGAMGDFCPLRLGNQWTYSRSVSTYERGPGSQLRSIRKFQVDSVAPEGDGKRYHLDVWDSVVSHTLTGPNPGPGGNQGKVQWLKAIVREAADGSLSAVWEDAAADRTGAQGPIDFLQYAFQSHRYSGFAITDTTPDLSHPQWAREWWEGVKKYRVEIDRDIGLQSYYEHSNGSGSYYTHTVTYNLLTFQAEAPVGIVPHPNHTGFNTRIRFDSKPQFFKGRRLDGRKAVGASTNPVSRD